MAELPLPPPPPPPPEDDPYNPFGNNNSSSAPPQAAAAAVGPPSAHSWEKANEELYKLNEGGRPDLQPGFPPPYGYPPPYSVPPWNYGYPPAYGYPPYGVPYGGPAYVRPPAYQYTGSAHSYGVATGPQMYPPAAVGPPLPRGNSKKTAAQQQQSPYQQPPPARFAGFKNSTIPTRPLSNSGAVRFPLSYTATITKNIHRFAPPPSNLPRPMINPKEAGLKKAYFDGGGGENESNGAVDSNRSSTGSSCVSTKAPSSTAGKPHGPNDDHDDEDESAFQSEGAMGMLELAKHHQQRADGNDKTANNGEDLNSKPLSVTIVSKNRPIPASTNSSSSSFHPHKKPSAAAKFQHHKNHAANAAAGAATVSFPPPPRSLLNTNRPLLPGGPLTGSNATSKAAEPGEVSDLSSATPSGGVVTVAASAAGGGDLNDPAVLARVEIMRTAGTRKWPPGVVRWIERSYAQQPRNKWIVLKQRLLDIITEEEVRGGLSIINWDLVDTLSVGIGTSGFDHTTMPSSSSSSSRRRSPFDSRRRNRNSPDNVRPRKSTRYSTRSPNNGRDGSSTSPSDDSHAVSSRNTRKRSTPGRSTVGSSRHYRQYDDGDEDDDENDAKSHAASRSSRLLSVVSSKALSQYGPARKSTRQRSRSNSKNNSIMSKKLKKKPYDAESTATGSGGGPVPDFISINVPKQLIKKYVSADGKKLVTSLATKFRGAGSVYSAAGNIKAPSVAGGGQFRRQGPQTEQDRRKLAERAHRFQGMLNDDSSTTVPEKDARALLKRKQQQQQQNNFSGHGSGDHGGDGEHDEYAADGPIVGTCEEVLKQFLRLTAAPDPSKVRPERVLRRALPSVMKRWHDHHDYADVKDQLKSIRQDITVQQIRNDLTAAAYEAHARVALVVGDKPEFNQCQQQLKALYKDLRQRRNELLATANAVRDLAQRTGYNANDITYHSVDEKVDDSAAAKTTAATSSSGSGVVDAENKKSLLENAAVEFLPPQARDELAKLERALECSREFLAYRLIYYALHWNLSDFANDKSALDVDEPIKKSSAMPNSDTDVTVAVDKASISIEYALGVANAWFREDTFAFFKYAERSPSSSPHGIEHYLLKWAIPALRRKIFTRMIISAFQPAVDVDFVEKQMAFGRVWAQFDYREPNTTLIADLNAARRRQIGQIEWREFLKIWDGIVFVETETLSAENNAEFDCKTMKKSLRIKPES